MRQSSSVSRFLLIALLAAAYSACDDAPAPPSPPGAGGGDGIQVRGTERLGWSQDAPSRSILQEYRFFLLVDDVRSALGSVECSDAGPARYECSAPLPRLTPGRHTLELLTASTMTGLESDRSSPLLVVMLASGTSAAHDMDSRRASGRLGVTCVTTPPEECFTVERLAADVGLVRRIVALPDDRHLLLRSDSEAAILPGGNWHRIELGRSPTGGTIEIADVAVDPDFRSTRFLFLAVMTTYPDGRRAVRIVRVREVGEVLGEGATILPDLPLSLAGVPVLTLARDRFVYLAMPEGHVVRFSREGAGAEGATTAFPIFARGPSPGTFLAWNPADQSLTGGNASDQSTIEILTVHEAPRTRPGVIASLTFPFDFRATGLRDLVVRPPATTIDDEPGVYALTIDPPGLHVGRFRTGAYPTIESVAAVSLGTVVPIAMAPAANRGVVIAARDHPESSSVDVLRLRTVRANAR